MQLNNENDKKEVSDCFVRGLNGSLHFILLHASPSKHNRSPSKVKHTPSLLIGEESFNGNKQSHVCLQSAKNSNKALNRVAST